MQKRRLREAWLARGSWSPAGYATGGMSTRFEFKIRLRPRINGRPPTRPANVLTRDQHACRRPGQCPVGGLGLSNLNPGSGSAAAGFSGANPPRSRHQLPGVSSTRAATTSGFLRNAVREPSTPARHPQVELHLKVRPRIAYASPRPGSAGSSNTSGALSSNPWCQKGRPQTAGPTTRSLPDHRR